MKKYSGPKIVLLLSRILGGCLFTFVAIFLVSEIVNQSESGAGFRSIYELLTFLMFPVSTLTGIAIAWKFEGTGGFIIISGIIVLIILRPDLVLSAPVLLSGTTGILFLTYWWIMKRQVS